MEYVKELEQLVAARTEQIRILFGKNQRAIDALNRAKEAATLTDAKASIDQVLVELMENCSPPSPRFGGEPGTPVPPVDPEDLQKVWEYTEQVRREHPNTAIGTSIYEQICKRGANIHAVCYRSQMFWLVTTFATEDIQSFSKEKLFKAMAAVDMEWMAPGVKQQGPPFDWDQFLQLCAV